MIQARIERAAGNRALAWGFLLAALLAAILLLAAKPAYAKTFTVNSTQDFSDIDPGDGICDTISSTLLNPCTLRGAIQETNANDNAPTVDTINFNIPNVADDELKTIKPNSEMPGISEPVTINGYSQAGATENTIAQGSTNAVLKIELDGTNVASFGDGLRLFSGSSDSVVKGLVINRFGDAGIWAFSVSDIELEGNFVGTDPSGILDRGNGQEGVQIESVSDATVGGSTPEARNLISGNTFDGVRIGTGSSGNRVLGNLIGTKKDGSGVLSNSDDGVEITNPGTINNFVGGNASEANRIGYNGDNGVDIFGNGTTGNRILRNHIFENDDLGIDLKNDGVTQNDLKDPDTGPNQLQNYPVLTSAITSGGTTTIQGTLNSTPNKTFTLRFFSNFPLANEDEGEKYIGQKSVTTNKNGNVSFTFIPSQTVHPGRTITATATNPGGNTSEFSSGEVV